MRTIPVPASRTRNLEISDARLAARAHSQVQVAGIVSGKALRPALIVLVQKGPQTPAWSKPSNESLVGPSLQRFDAAVDQAFFESLWADFELDEDEARAAWAERLAVMARRILNEAVDRAPRGQERRFIAHARASNLLEGALHKHLPELARRRSISELEDDQATAG